MSLTREQRRMAAMATLEAARTGGQLPAEIWASAQRKDDELIELATAYKDSRKQEVLENIVLTLAALESLARPYTVVYQPPTGGTPVPAPAAPTPPKQAPGTRQWAPSQATPPKPASPATPVVPPSSPGMDLESMKLDIASAVKDGVIELLTPMAQVLPSDNKGFLPVASKAEVDELGERFKVLDTKVKAINTNAGRVKAPLKKVWPSLGLGVLVGLLIGLGLFSLVGIVVAIVLGGVGFALVAAAMIALFNSDRNTAPAQ